MVHDLKAVYVVVVFIGHGVYPTYKYRHLARGGEAVADHGEATERTK